MAGVRRFPTSRVRADPKVFSLAALLLLSLGSACIPAPEPRARATFREQCLEEALPLLRFLETGEGAVTQIPSSLPAGFLERMRETAGLEPQGDGSSFRALRLFPGRDGAEDVLGMQMEFEDPQRKWTFYARWKNSGGTALLHDLIYSGEKGFLFRIEREGDQEVLSWREERWYSIPWRAERELFDRDSFRAFNRKIKPLLVEEVVSKMDRAVDPEWTWPGPLPADALVIWADPDCSFLLVSWLLSSAGMANIGSVELVDEVGGRVFSIPLFRGTSGTTFLPEASRPRGFASLKVDPPGLAVLDPETRSTGFPEGRWHIFPGRHIFVEIHPNALDWVGLEREEFLSRVEKFPDKKVLLFLAPRFGVLYSEAVFLLGDLRDRGYEYSLVGGSLGF